MKLDLTDHQAQRIVQIVRAINQAYQDTWRACQRKLEWSLDTYRQSQAHYQKITELVLEGNEPVDMRALDMVVPSNLYDDNRIIQAIQNNEYDDIYDEYLERIWKDYTDNMFEIVREYLLKNCHLPIYDMEDNHVSLRSYIDFNELMPVPRKILDDIDQWWGDNARGRSIEEYRDYLTQINAQRERQFMAEKRANDWKKITQDYHFDTPSPNVVRCYNHRHYDPDTNESYADGPDYDVLDDMEGDNLVDAIQAQVQRLASFPLKRIKNVHIYHKGYITFSFHDEKTARRFYEIVTKDGSVRSA